MDSQVAPQQIGVNESGGMNLRWALLRGQGSSLPWGNYFNIRTIAASKKRSKNDLLLNGEPAAANGKSFAFFDPENCPSFDNSRPFTRRFGRNFSTKMLKSLWKSRRGQA
jgi:hypothetical protein